MIPYINPVWNWNFTSQTDVNEQEKVVFASEFLNSLVSVTQSILRVAKKMKFFKSLITHDSTYQPVRNWNFVSQTDANEQEKAVFASEFLNSFVPVTQSILRVTKKMKIFKSYISHINPVRNWNFISQTDVIEQEKAVFTSRF